MKRHRINAATGMVLLLFLALASGLVARSRSTTPLPFYHPWSESVVALAAAGGIPVVKSEEVQAMLESGSHLFLDARDAESYAAGHLPMALSLPEDAFEEGLEALADILTPEVPLLVYCGGMDCDAALHVAEQLRDAGFVEVQLFAEGYARWVEEGRDVE